MRKLILSLHVTPDGFCNHDAAVFGDDWMTFVTDQTEEMGTVAFGRVTYELFEGFWPKLARERNGSAEMLRYADMIDAKEKLVFSRTLSGAQWRNTTVQPVVNREVVDELKRQDKGDIIVFGGAALISELISLDAFDEYFLLIQPMFAGAGYRLFSDIRMDRLPLTLSGTKTFSQGVLQLHYLPAASSRKGSG
jgi:dihydrofolate reductase